MPSYSLTGLVAFCTLIARISYRNAELRILSWLLERRLHEVVRIAYAVGGAFRDRTPLFSGVYTVTLNHMGHAVDKNDNRVSPFCWNASIGITIALNEEAHFGLGVEFRGRAVCIRQMQGVEGRKPPPGLADWPEIFVKACIAFAKERGFKEVRIYKADQDFNFEHPSFDLEDWGNYKEVKKKHQDRMRRRYDRTAQKLKFEKKKRYYVRRIVA